MYIRQRIQECCSALDALTRLAYPGLGQHDIHRDCPTPAAQIYRDGSATPGKQQGARSDEQQVNLSMGRALRVHGWVMALEPGLAAKFPPQPGTP